MRGSRGLPGLPRRRTAGRRAEARGCAPLALDRVPATGRAISKAIDFAAPGPVGSTCQGHRRGTWRARAPPAGCTARWRATAPGAGTPVPQWQGGGRPGRAFATCATDTAPARRRAHGHGWRENPRAPAGLAPRVRIRARPGRARRTMVATRQSGPQPGRDPVPCEAREGAETPSRGESHPAPRAIPSLKGRRAPCALGRPSGWQPPLPASCLRPGGGHPGLPATLQPPGRWCSPPKISHRGQVCRIPEALPAHPGPGPTPRARGRIRVRTWRQSPPARPQGEARAALLRAHQLSPPSRLQSRHSLPPTPA